MPTSAIGEARVGEFVAAEIDAEFQVWPAVLLPCAHLAHGFDKRPETEATHAAGFGGQRDDVGDGVAEKNGSSQRSSASMAIGLPVAVSILGW